MLLRYDCSCTRGCKVTEADRRHLCGFVSSSVSKPLPLPREASEHSQRDGSLREHENREVKGREAKSLLLTVPLAVSALLSLSLQANAVCWSWKPCADYQGGYGYGAPPTESQSVLPPLPPGNAPPPGSQTGQQAATAAPAPAGAGKSETEAGSSPGAGTGGGAALASQPAPAQVPAQAKAQPAPPPQPAPVQATKPAPAPAPASAPGTTTVPGTATMQVIPEYGTSALSSGGIGLQARGRGEGSASAKALLAS